MTRRGRQMKGKTMVAVLAGMLASYALAAPLLQNVRTAPQMPSNDSLKTAIKAQPTLNDEEHIPDSLLHPRWKIQRTTPITYDDLDQNPADLKRPDNLKQEVEYNDTLNRYVIGSKIGDTYINAPIMMTAEEYGKWTEKKALNAYFRSKNAEIYKTKGKEKFDFTDMHFDLGPAEKIFGPGGVRIKTQGSAELKFGATLKTIDNPSLPIRNRKTTALDFDEKINLNLNGKVGDKVNLNLNYNTDATFDYDAQNLKLKYEGKEDEIIKLVEAGNVSFPTNSSLIKGASALFGVRTDMQFGKLKLQTVFSQKKSSTKTVSSRGGVQLTPFEINVADYEENRHFFLAHYFRDQYAAAMSRLPNLMTGVTINRVEVWVTNNSGNTTNTRNIIALTDLGESTRIHNSQWSSTGMGIPSNASNSEYAVMVNNYSAARNIDRTSSVLDGAGLTGGSDYEKIERARLLTPSEYTINTALGYLSLNMTLQPDQVLAVAFEYTYGGTTYQVGEFASDNTDVNQALFVKSLKNTSNNPRQGNWDLMMKNVYYLGGSTIERDKFRLDVKYQSDTAGVYLSYIPEQQVKSQPIIRLLGADRLDNNNQPHANGYFDYVEGYTVNKGRVFFPEPEPFGSYMYDYLTAAGVSAERAGSYAFTELYDSIKTTARQIAEKNKYMLVGQYRGTAANVISLGAYNVPQGSVVVTAGGITLQEGSDYSVDYSGGTVTILNQSILDAGTNVSVSLESNTDYGQERKTIFGLNWEYDFTKNLQMSGTVMHLSEQALTSKVNMGSEPLNNTLWGVNLNWKKESQWLTNLLDKIPFLHLTQPSQISFTGEFAHLIAGQSSGTQDNASYIDDFENSTNKISILTPTSWMLSSVPGILPEANDKTSLRSGFNRSLLSWYTIDPLFTRRSSSLTPGHIRSDLEQLSNYYVREVYVNELYPHRDQSSYNGATATLSVLNLTYYPNERGPYNFSPDINPDGTMNNPQKHWGGMMRKIDNSNFEESNIEYIEFWMLDPFIYTREQGKASEYGGDFYIDLGELSEDVLKDGKKIYESGMPVDGSKNWTETQWGRIPNQATVTYAFATDNGSRALQDVGLNGLNDEEELNFAPYQDFLNNARSKVTEAVWDSIKADPANDNYHYYRGTDYDNMQASIIRRYKYINNPQGNSPDNQNRKESYDTSYKTTPDVEDINQDYTLNEYEKYYQYHVSIRPEDLVVGTNYIVDKRETAPGLRKGGRGKADWYLFRIPLHEFQRKVGGISDFSSIRFMRVYLTGFAHPITLRLGSFDLVRGEWRSYDQRLTPSAETGTMSTASVNIEENNDKTPVNYVLPPGISRVQDPTQPQLVESNEQALAMTVTNLSNNESKSVYKNTSLDLRQYKQLQMFIHANAFEQNLTNLKDNQLAAFIRLGSDYKNNYYEYEIPLKLTAPKNTYNKYSTADRKEVWPEENMLNIPLDALTALKRDRNKARANGQATYTRAFSAYDSNHPNNKMTIMGNPTLGEVKTIIIGVRNLAAEQKSGEVWFNELRLRQYNNEGGWAAQGNLNIQLSDFGSVNLQGRYSTTGFGGLEEGVQERALNDNGSYTFTTNLELGKFFPDKAKVSIPIYYSVSKEEIKPKYNPLDTDLKLNDALEAASPSERDSIESIAVTKTVNTNFAISNARIGIATKRHPMPYDPVNFSFSYSHSHRHTQGETTIYENEDAWRGAMDYNWSPVYPALEPFKKIKSKSKYFEILKRFGINWLPQNIGFHTEILRNYYELQERDMESTMGNKLPLTFSEQFLWNREFQVRWDITKNLHTTFQSATNAEIEEPYTPVNKALFPDRYEAWKDSVNRSLRSFGTPLSYNQSFQASYQLPLNLIPIFDWVNSNASFTSTYSWQRGTMLADSINLGNTITNNRTINIDATLNLVKLYNHIPFLKKTNDRFDRQSANRLNRLQNKQQNRIAALAQKQTNKSSKKDEKAEEQKQQLPKNKNTFEQEITLLPDSNITIQHGKNSKRLIVRAKTPEGRTFKLKYRKKDGNTLVIRNKVDSTMKLKISVTPKAPLDEQKWYKSMQTMARILMMVRNINVSYSNRYSMALPGFMPHIGDAFGQTRNSGVMSPGLDFAFGLTGDGYIEKAKRNGWLLNNDSVATPATTNFSEDLQLRITLEPLPNLKIDLNANRSITRGRSVQYMYVGNPTTESGTFNMTTISLKSALTGGGNARNGFHNTSFEKFVHSLESFRNRVEAQYKGAPYPQGSTLSGKTFDPQNGGVNKYSADVMVPAFLAAYTNMGGKSLKLFPTLTQMLPNWSFRYSGLGQLPFLSELFKSVNINHAYRSVYSVGAYSSYSTFMEYFNGLGFILNTTTGNPVPNSMYNVSTVSINEAFSPLLGIDVTLHNNLTAKVEYRTTRVLSLSMTSVQINEATSHDWVVGASYKITDFNPFGGRNRRKTKRTGNEQQNTSRSQPGKDLNMRLDMSFRKQANINRDIATMTSSATSGNTALRISFSADYTLSRLLTMSFYYDQQINTPLLANNTYPTTTRDFGVSIKFSLTR